MTVGKKYAGRRGLPGVGVVDSYIDEDSHLIQVLSDGTTLDAGYIPGEDVGTVAAAGITDATTVGRAVLTAVDQAAARAAIGAGTGSGAGLADGDYGDVTVAGTGTTMTVENNAITNAKAADMAQATIKGRATGAGTGDPTDLTPTQVTTIVEAATESVAGKVELATASETSTGTDATRAVTPAGLKPVVDGKLAAAVFNAYNVEPRALWSGTAWPARPSIAGYTGPVIWDSAGDSGATAPTGSVAGDRWRRRLTAVTP